MVGFSDRMEKIVGEVFADSLGSGPVPSVLDRVSASQEAQSTPSVAAAINHPRALESLGPICVKFGDALDFDEAVFDEKPSFHLSDEDHARIMADFDEAFGINDLETEDQHEHEGGRDA